MTTQTWRWAELTPEQQMLLDEAERTLGTDYLLVYQSSEPPEANRLESLPSDLPVARLNESQLECLRGLESRLQAVVVAYQK